MSKEYKLKEGEKWESDAITHPPHFCPNCGRDFGNKPAAFWSDSSRPSTPDNPFRGTAYDCYCETCHWSGDVFPYEDSQIVEERNEVIPYSKIFGKKKRKET